MRCVEPYVKAGEVYPCGRCLPCKFKARRIWFHRVLLEASQHDYSTVVNLTYDEAALPLDGNVSGEHLRNWLKRFRKRSLERYPWRRLRFFACAEYGERSGRPHYHCILFGQPGCEFGRTGRFWCGDCSCLTCTDVSDTWGFGACSCQALDWATAAYVAGYVTRKVLAEQVWSKTRPFLRMSNRPGIGASAMWDVASVMMQYFPDANNVPMSIRTVGRSMLLGRYLRRKLAEAVDVEVPVFEPTPAMHAVRELAFSLSRSQSGIYREINEVYASQFAQREALKEKVL